MTFNLNSEFVRSYALRLTMIFFISAFPIPNSKNAESCLPCDLGTIALAKVKARMAKKETPKKNRAGRKAGALFSGYL
jgi:hypothetical protein